jgi:hypothetical protein
MPEIQLNNLAKGIIDDLRAFSADLLEVGLTPGGSSLPGQSDGTSAGVVRSVSYLTSLVPRLLAELRTVEAPTHYVENVTYVPTGARLSRRPADYRLSGDRVMPWRWVRMVPLPERDTRPLRWLLYLLDRLRELLIDTEERTEKRVAEALAARRGTSVWAQADAHGLRQILERVREARALISRATKRVQQSAGPRPVPSKAVPNPYPRSPTWVSLRRLAARLTDPMGSLPDHIRSLLRGPEPAADLPFLYQRWCGVKIVRTLESLGWEMRGDPVGAIFLGGLITFQLEGHTLDLWLEPRLERRAVHACGFRCIHGEDITPDFLFITPGPGGPEAFILDATLVTAPEGLVAKGRYLDLIELNNFVRVGGCPVRRRPRLAWAAAPLMASHGKVLRQDGAIGAIPMNPADWNDQPLREWLSDIARHAFAWSLVEKARRP